MSEVLSPLDSFFLHLESPRTPMHMGSISIFEGGPLTAPDGTLRLDELRRRIEDRLWLVPKLRRRLSGSPLGLLARQWTDDPGFDVKEHVRQAGLPPPGTETQLLESCAEILSWPLDRSRPLWELWLVGGLQGGRVAVLEKLHHSLADGLAGVELATVLLDVRRHPRPAAAPPPWHPRQAPGIAEVVANDVAALAERTGRRATRAAASLRHPLRTLDRAARTAEGMTTLLRPEMVAPHCSINTSVGRRRRVAVVRHGLGSLRAVEHWGGVTLNDVLLTAVAGGMRALHVARGEPLHGLQVLVPVGFAHPRGRPLGNVVSAMVVRLPLDEEDPVACLQRVAAAVTERKRHHQARGGAAVLSALGIGLQPGIGAVAEIVQHQPFVNLVVTNVPGPRYSLYAMGARMIETIPIVPIAGNLSIGVAALSYHGQLTVGILADRARCPDVEVVAEGMAHSFDVLARRARTATRARPTGPGGSGPVSSRRRVRAPLRGEPGRRAS